MFAPEDRLLYGQFGIEVLRNGMQGCSPDARSDIRNGLTVCAAGQALNMMPPDAVFTLNESRISLRSSGLQAVDFVSDLAETHDATYEIFISPRLSSNVGCPAGD